jgi:F-type H+-transporting ATPase subunit b
MHFDAEFFVAVAFVIFIGVMGYVGVHRTLLGALDKRRDRIKSELDEARRLREEAANLLAEYQRKQREAQREADAIVAGAQAEAERLAAEAAVAAAERVLAQTTKGKLAEQLLAQGIQDLKSKLN